MVKLLYMMDHPDLTVSNFMGKSTLVHKGLMDHPDLTVSNFMGKSTLVHKGLMHVFIPFLPF